jgi:two-component system OmpR family sensor kinase
VTTEPAEVPDAAPPSGGVPAPGAQAGPSRRPWARLPTPVRNVWVRTPLRTRLVGIITALLAAGLLIAGLTTATLLERFLVGQVDERLATEARYLAERQVQSLLRGDAADDGSLLPTDYALVVTDVTGGRKTIGRDPTYEAYGVPSLPDLTPAEARRRALEPFDVRSSRPGSSWRVVTFPVSNFGEDVATVSVGLPLGDIERTVRGITLLLLTSGLGIIVLGALAGSWAVRRALRPLQEIESTAASIAAGDLSRRVPAAPASTEVGRLGDALNGMLTQIESAFADRTVSEARMRRFVADASHELRTPLAAIRGYGELYRMGALTEKEQVDDTFRRVEESATRMGGLVEDLLALARLDDGRPMRHDDVDLAVLAADALSDLHALDPSRATALLALDGGTLRSCVVAGDERMLRQVVSNLVGNVVQHTPAGTPVELSVGVRAHPPGGAEHGVLEVRDHGPGIDPEHAARVFERFYRVDASRTRGSTTGGGTGGGAGLGMAIVAAIVAAHRGDVGLEQTPGGGTTVCVSLPLAGRAGAAREPVDEAVDDAGAGPGGARAEPETDAG